MSPRLRSYAAIGAATLVPLAIYVASARTGVSFWDTGDLQTVPYMLGIPYPTGFPGYVLIGWVWSHAFAVGSVAWRLNLLAALATAAASGALAASLIVIGVLDVVALAGALAFAFSQIVWERATYVDAHRIAFGIALVGLAFALRWRRDGRPHDVRWSALAAALALAIDDAAVLLLPALAIVLWGRPLEARRALVLGAGCALLVAATYAYLPIRSAIVTAERADPTLALGIPPGRPFWDDHHPASLSGFVRLVAGTDFAPHAAAAEMISARALLRVARDAGPPLRRDYGALGLVLAVAGFVVAYRREPRVLAAACAFGLVPLLFVVSYGAEADSARYYAPAYAAVALLAAYGASAILTALPPLVAAASAIAGAVAFAALLATDAGENAGLFAQRDNRDAAAFADRVVAKTPADAIVVAPWAYAPALAYRAYVEHGFGRRILVTAWPSDVAGELAGWLRERPVILVGAPEGGIAQHTQPVDIGDPVLARVEAGR